MFDKAAPSFHADFLVELYEQTGSRELVGTAAQLLLKDCFVERPIRFASFDDDADALVTDALVKRFPVSTAATELD
jgi:hypothetical protein